MAVMLEGGCFVADLKEGEPELREDLRIWRHIHRGTGTKAISMRVLELPAGSSGALCNSRSDEVLYVFEGAGTLTLDGRRYELEPDLGIFVGPDVSFSVQSSSAGPLTIVSAQCPDPGTMVEQSARRNVHAEPHAVQAATVEGSEQVSSNSPANPVVRLRDRAPQATGDRWYRVLVDKELGCNETTQFVGSIPPGRAPDHFHHYEEVLCILQGTGRMWAGESSTPIRRGSCVFLPRGQVHCVENTGSSELRLLGVFHPAGSPADRYSETTAPPVSVRQIVPSE
jgi:mannose-6-phosphate isomerase-like protein (cupin superfamily)